LDNPEQALQKARTLFAQGEHSRSLAICEQLVESFGEHDEMEDLIEQNREILETVYLRKLGDLSAVPQVVISGSQLQAADIDHRMAFLLTRMDGDTSIEEVLDISGMNRLDASRLLLDALEKGLITLA
jgi:hypothetical protein